MVKIDFRVVFETVAAEMATSRLSAVSNQINTGVVDRQSGTDRSRNGCKARKSYCFTEHWDIHDVYLGTGRRHQYLLSCLDGVVNQ